MVGLGWFLLKNSIEAKVGPLYKGKYSQVNVLYHDLGPKTHTRESITEGSDWGVFMRSQRFDERKIR